VKLLKSFIIIGIVALFFWLAFKDFSAEDLASLWQIIQSVNFSWVLLTIVVLGLSNLVRAWRWKYLLKDINSNVKLSDCYHATMIGYAVNLVLPRVGEISKSVHLSKKTKIDIKQILASVLVERMLDSLVFVLIFALSSFMFRVKLSEVFGEISIFGASLPIHLFSVLLVLITIAIMIGFTIIVLFPNLLSKLIEKFFNVFSNKIGQKLSEYFHVFIEGAVALKNPGGYAVIMLSSIIIWGIYFLGTLFPFYAMSFNQNYSLGGFEAMATMSISAFGQFITPAGAGTYQYICQNVLNNVFMVNLTEASAFALMVFTITIFTYGVLGAISFITQTSQFKLSNDVNKDFALNNN